MTSPQPQEAGNGTIVLVGCGNMGGALLAGWIASGTAPSRIIAIDPTLPRVPQGVTVLGSAAEIPAIAAETLVLAVKPQKLTEVAPSLVNLVGPKTIVVSILAVGEIATLRGYYPAAAAIVRAVPNLPVAIRRGITALVADTSAPWVREAAEGLFTPLGKILWLEREALCHAVTSVSGCGPAFLFRFAEAMTEAGVSIGLSADQAQRLVVETLLGACALLAESGKPPAALATQVASPGGVTLEGLKVLDQENRLKRLMVDTLHAANERSKELSRTLSR